MNNIDTTVKTTQIALPPLLKGAIGAIIVTLLGSAVLAAAFCLTDLSTTATHAIQLPLLGLAAFVGAFIAAKSAGRKGLHQGLRMAALLLAIMAIFTFVGGSFSPIALILKGIIILATAAMGGILGVF